MLAQDPKTIILDVRPEEQFKITRLPNAVNSGWERTLSRADSLENILPNEFSPELDNILVMCRYGNDSRYALRKLKDQFGLKKYTTSLEELIDGVRRLTLPFQGIDSINKIYD